MERKYGSKEEALEVAKEAVYLAWKACGDPAGYGVFQDRGPDQDREKVWEHAYNERDYYGRNPADEKRINCDYVMGRMMKLRFKLDGEKITHHDYELRRDYQAWCAKYPTFASLFEAAELAALAKGA